MLHFKDCYVEGTLDFIFGVATALFDDCTIVSKGKLGWIAAASTLEAQRFGYVFRRVLQHGEGAGTAHLGRSWWLFARTLFLQSNVGLPIVQSGWHNWDKLDAERTTYYGEFGSVGAGALSEERVACSHRLSVAGPRRPHRDDSWQLAAVLLTLHGRAIVHASAARGGT